MPKRQSTVTYGEVGEETHTFFNSVPPMRRKLWCNEAQEEIIITLWGELPLQINYANLYVLY